MEEIGDCANIYVYENILKAVRSDELDSLNPWAVGYYALLTGKPRPDTNGIKNIADTVLKKLAGIELDDEALKTLRILKGGQENGQGKRLSGRALSGSGGSCGSIQVKMLSQRRHSL